MHGETLKNASIILLWFTEGEVGAFYMEGICNM